MGLPIEWNGMECLKLNTPAVPLRHQVRCNVPFPPTLIVEHSSGQVIPVVRRNTEYRIQNGKVL